MDLSSNVPSQVLLLPTLSLYAVGFAYFLCGLPVNIIYAHMDELRSDECCPKNSLFINLIFLPFVLNLQLGTRNVNTFQVLFHFLN